MFHDAGNQHIFAVADGIHLAFFAFQVFIDQDRMFGIQFNCQRHIAHQFGGIMHDFHGPAAQHIAGAHHDRIADKLGYIQSFINIGDTGAGRLRNTHLAEDFFKTAAVFGEIDILGTGAQYRHAGIGPADRPG